MALAAYTWTYLGLRELVFAIPPRIQALHFHTCQCQHLLNSPDVFCLFVERVPRPWSSTHPPTNRRHGEPLMRRSEWRRARWEERQDEAARETFPCMCECHSNQRRWRKRSGVHDRLVSILDLMIKKSKREPGSRPRCGTFQQLWRIWMYYQ